MINHCYKKIFNLTEFTIGFVKVSNKEIKRGLMSRSFSDKEKSPKCLSSIASSLAIALDAVRLVMMA